MAWLTAVKLLKDLGVELGIDWDGELLTRCPTFVDGAVIEDLIAEHSEQLAREVAAAGRREMECFVGGPFNGTPHNALFEVGGHRGYRLGPKRWAVYQFHADGRAFFRGFATSQAKARRGEIIPESIPGGRRAR